MQFAQPRKDALVEAKERRIGGVEPESLLLADSDPGRAMRRFYDECIRHALKAPSGAGTRPALAPSIAEERAAARQVLRRDNRESSAARRASEGRQFVVRRIARIALSMP
ncbi:MAG TPA: hypothetical protein VFA50_05705 [Stellaceae bacterium]|nr:hypothetical protein [Stellaceae bacterium]